MTEDTQTSVEDSPATVGKAGLLTRPRLVAAAIALGGMIVGSLVGIAVQVGVESTGVLGPGVDALIEEQQANFGSISAQLDALRRMTTDPDVKRNLAELEKLLARQEELQQQATTELAYLGDQVAGLKQQALTEQGFAGGADLWLKAGESVNVGDARQVLGVTRVWSQRVDVNVNGKKTRLAVGDVVEVPAADRSCSVFFKQAQKREDGRVGFDLSCG